MLLSELKTGSSAVVVKVLGHGGFRRRILEMGFVRGQRVTAVLNAPLRDPIKYGIMGYEVSLRRSEAAMVEVLTPEEAHEYQLQSGDVSTSQNEDVVQDVFNEKVRHIKIALVGNPNSGKTSLFNALSGGHEHVGNYSGVTVDAKSGELEYKGYKINITDLPGTYALSAYTPEELYVRQHLMNELPDVVVNAVVAIVFSVLENVEDGSRKVIGVCWGAHLVEHYLQLWLACCEGKHRLHEILAELAVEPCGAQDKMVAPYSLYILLAMEFAESIDACGCSFLILGTRCIVGVAAKHIIG